MERDIKITGMRCQVSTSRKQRSDHSKKYSPQQLTVEEKRRKRISGLCRTLCSLSKQPLLFITLMIPGVCCDAHDYINFRIIFNSFVRRIKYNFKNCWFIYKCEWKQNVGFHVHMLGNLFRKPKLNFKASKRKKVYQLWIKSIAEHGRMPQGNAKPCHIQKCKFKRHAGYLTKKAKKYSDMEYIRKSDGAQTWNYINKNNIPFVPTIYATISENAYDIFIEKLNDKLSNTNYNIEYIEQNMHKKFASFSFIDNNILLKSISGACKEANDGSTVHDI